MNFKKFISELKRRNVFKVATAYAITGWLIIQIVTSISEPLSLPPWFDTVIIIFVLIGFPLSLLFAWAFELTPDGLKKTKQVEVQQSVTKKTGKHLNKVIITTLVILIGFLVYERFLIHDHEETVTDTLPSIAVLPFADMSPKNDQEYFSDGLSEELLNVLAKVKNVKVAGRTSSFKFKGKNDDLKKIGAELGVAHILEGSVRKSGSTIRITAQLIKVSDGFHMWSETYDRDYTADNLFKIQDEISKEVLKELKIKLAITNDASDSTYVNNKAFTSNTEAYEAYLKGNQLLINRNPDDIEKAIEEFKKAIALDDQFALAHARLATSYGHLFNYGSIKQEEAFKSMREYIDKALLLDSNLGSAYAALGHYYKDRNPIFNEDDENSYKEAMKKSFELEPNNPEIMMWYGNSLDADDDNRIGIYLKAFEIDPLAPVLIQNIASTYQFREEYEKAETYAKKNIELNPEYIRSRTFLINLLTSKPNAKLGEGFIEAYKTYQQYPEHLDVINTLAFLAIELDLMKVSHQLEKEMLALYPENFSVVGIQLNNYMIAGKLDDASSLLETFFDNATLKKGSLERMNFELLIKFLIKKDVKGSLNYIQEYHPIYLSDTITTLDKGHQDYLPEIATILKKNRLLKQADRLINLHYASTKKLFKYDGDIEKEEVQVLYKLLSYAAFKGDAKLYRDILNEQHFTRKIKNRININFDLDPINDEIRDAPEIKQILQRIDNDLASMRAKAVTFLKDEGLWDKYKEENEK